MYIDIVLAGIFVYLFFRGLTILVKILPFSRSTKLYTRYIMPVVELVLWVGFIMWTVRLMYEAYNTTALIVSGTLTILFIVPMWFLIRDFLNGVIMKVQRKIDLGNTIEIEGIKGVVIKAGHLSFDIRTKDGSIKTIPYNKVMSRIISKQGSNVNLDSQVISFRVDSSNDIDLVTAGLRATLTNAPWVAASQEPIINNVRKESGEYIVDVVVYILKQEHVQKIKDYVTSKTKILKGSVSA